MLLTKLKHVGRPARRRGCPGVRPHRTRRPGPRSGPARASNRQKKPGKATRRPLPRIVSTGFRRRAVALDKADVGRWFRFKDPRLLSVNLPAEGSARLVSLVRSDNLTGQERTLHPDFQS